MNEDPSEFFNELDLEHERSIRRAEAVAGAVAAVRIYGMDLDEADLPEFFKLVSTELGVI